MLRPDLLPHPLAKTPEDIETERCCCYVGWSRHMDRAYAVEDWPFDNKCRDLIFERPEEYLGYPDVDRPGHSRQAIGRMLEDMRPQGDGACDAFDDAEDAPQMLGGFVPWAVPAVPAEMKPPVEKSVGFVDDGEPF